MPLLTELPRGRLLGNRASSIKYSRERHGPGPMGKTFGEHNMAANYYPKISFVTLQVECPPYQTGAELTIRPTAAKRSSRKLGFRCMAFPETRCFHGSAWGEKKE
jgi:hypothetical protein